MSDQPDLWLVRTHQNRILGPFPAAEIRTKILSRELGPEDEVAQANSYWFSLHEPTELKNQLGIELPPRLREDDEEVTDTQTATTNTLNTHPELENYEQRGERSPGESSASSQWTRKTPAVVMETAGVSQRPRRRSRIERMAILRYAALALLFAAAFLFFLVWRILRSG